MVVMAGQAGTRQLFLMDEMWRAGAVCQTQPTEFTRFASEKYFVNRSSPLLSSVRDSGQERKLRKGKRFIFSFLFICKALNLLFNIVSPAPLLAKTGLFELFAWWAAVNQPPPHGDIFYCRYFIHN